MYRKTDPETSRLAAYEHEGQAQTNRGVIFRLIRQHPGLTCRELQQRQPRLRDGSRRLDAYEISKRVSELNQLGLLVEVGRQRCRVTGKRARSWAVRKRAMQPCPRCGLRTCGGGCPSLP